MTETAFRPSASAGEAWRLLLAFVTRPRSTLRSLDDGLGQLLAGWLLLFGIVLVNVLVGLLVGRDDAAGRLLEAVRTAVLVALLVPSVFWLLLRGLTPWHGGWQRLHVAVILAMLPLALGSVPVLGLVAAGAMFALLLLIPLDVAQQPPLRAVVLWLLMLGGLVAVALAYNRIAGAF
ncbi:hypothetical protein TVNIR_2507 [Thioalkalivibrio nitratireducens DSM 14787]|uniref:Yip1 domain-containing protein n=1 Tax=Thioalkalivibrio nitratireducens (strain DSM 14787 / UNIQEM 213 / ALEN2) TaxID=1255043 RepID=L0DYV9_THIND|nr:hypothetical protein [Thioalkalivibrio nitratireducens]AGA34150.1 hypothetical protein TVNIR_2507 [Thioalkalivibrio nitratireducens DSM 14787]